jgi:hypothetical protein
MMPPPLTAAFCPTQGTFGESIASLSLGVLKFCTDEVNTQNGSLKDEIIRLETI